MVIFVILIVLLVLVALEWFNQKKVPNNTITAFTGSLGSGKTFLAVRYAIRNHRANLIRYYLERILPFKKRFLKKPKFYSNIPVRIWGNQWAEILTYSHLILKDKIDEYATILIDEIGHFASQYEYDHPFVQQFIQEFIRFFRHYIDGKLFITDQSSSNIVVSIRRRINQIYNLSNFSRSWFLFYRVNVSEIHITEDILNVQPITNIDELPYFFGFLPFRFMSIFGFKPNYDSRCYSINYVASPSQMIGHWANYKTDYFIELPNSPILKQNFKKNGFITIDEATQTIDEWKKRQIQPTENKEIK